MKAHWISTTKKNRDQGVYHLERFIYGGTPRMLQVVEAACGAKPFAFGGSFPESEVPESSRCRRCQVIADRIKATGHA